MRTNKPPEKESEKMEDIMIVIPFALAIVIIVVIRVLAGTNSILGKIFRWFWNASFKLASHIPFCGWMAVFIIADTKKEKAAKEIYLKIGSEVDDLGMNALSSAAEKQHAQRRREEAIRTQLAAQGFRDVSVNADGTLATVKDRHGNIYNVHITE